MKFFLRFAPRNLILPTVHLNGTAKEALMDSLTEARSALRGAIEKLEAAAPHQRDYYPQGAGAYEFARGQHQGRVAKLSGVSEQLASMLEALEDPRLIEERESPFEVAQDAL
jgi:hypothetical protein